MSRKLIILISVCTLCLAANSVQAVNVLTNGDFETGDLTGWWTWDGGGDGTYAVQSSTVYEGSYALMVQGGPSGYWGTVGQDPGLSSGAYTISGALNSSADNQGIGIKYYDSGWADLGWDWITLANTSGSWDVFSSSFTAPAGTAYLDVTLQSGSIATYYDSISVIPEPATMVLLGIGGLIALRRKHA